MALALPRLAAARNNGFAITWNAFDVASHYYIAWGPAGSSHSDVDVVIEPSFVLHDFYLDAGATYSVTVSAMDGDSLIVSATISITTD